MKVAIIGSRSCKNLDLSKLAEKLPHGCTEIISGGAVGVDTAAEELAHMLNLKFVKFMPDYKTYGKKAPLVRNEKIVDYADEVLAFWDMSSRGTAYTIDLCVKKGIPFRMFGLNE